MYAQTQGEGKSTIITNFIAPNYDLSLIHICEQADKLDLKDDVLRRANGFYTYFAADIAYHRNKLEQRGFSKAINIWRCV